MKTFLCLLLGLSGLMTAHAAPGVEEVTAAAAGDDTAALIALLDKGGPLDERNARGWTPLICAIKAGRTDAVRALLARHVDPKKVTAANCSPLDFAVIEHDNEIASLLIDAGADVNRLRFSGSETRSFSPLLLTANHGYPDTAAILLAHGARVNAVNDDGDTALMEASRKSYPETIRVLLEHGADANAHRDSGLNALILAAYNGCAEGVRLLLAHGADLHATAVEGGPRFGALEAAAEQGRPYVLEILADAGAAPAIPHAKLNDELDSALQFDDYERAQAALAKGASPTEPDHNNILPITVAVLKGNPGIVRMLIKAGADVNAIPPDGDPRGSALALAREQIESAKTPPDKARFEQVADILRQAGATR